MVEGRNGGGKEWWREGMMHSLKISPKYFDAVVSGNKTFEVRKNDRSFHVDDRLLLQEYCNGAYTGRYIEKRITYIFDDPEYCREGYVILGLGIPRDNTRCESITYEEAYEMAKGGLIVYENEYPHLKDQIAFQEKVIEALEKQIPKQPVRHEGTIQGEWTKMCPRCAKTLVQRVTIENGSTVVWKVPYRPQYCDCGQKLKWP